MAGAKLVHQAQSVQVMAQSEAPMRQQALFVLQLQVPHTSVVMVLQAQARPVIPALRACRLHAEQALIGGHQHTGHKAHLGVQVNLQQRTNVFIR